MIFRDEQDFYIGGIDLDQLDDSALAEEIGDEAADAIAAKGAENGDDRLSVALGQIPTWQHAAIVLAIYRWIEARKGLDDQLWPTLRQLRTRIAWLSHLAARGGDRADQHRADADALRALFAALTGGMSAGGLDDEGLDDDTDDDGLDDDDDDDDDDDGLDDDTDDGLDDDTDDDGLDDDDLDDDDGLDDHAELVGLATAAHDDPAAYLAVHGAHGLAALGAEVLDDEGLDDDTDDDTDDGLDDEGLDSNPCPRPPECDWCGGKGCDTCCDPNYAGVDP